MDKNKDVVLHRTKLPSYLSALLEAETEVLLVSAKDKENGNVTVVAEQEVSYCNLTGNPLEMSLSVCPIDLTVVAFNQSINEKYTPISLSLAREFINQYNESVHNEESMICLCDGKDEMNTVMLSSLLINGSFVRMMAFVEQCTTVSELESSLDCLRSYHIQNVGIGSHDVDIQALCIQQLYGYELFNHHLEGFCEIVGSVQMESLWSVLQYHIPEHGAAIKLMIQVIVGHENSIIYSMFQELQYLNYCLSELASNKVVENLVLSSEPTDINELYKNIDEVLHSVHVFNLQISKQDDVFDFNRDTSLTDKLWNIFKCCNTVKDLLDCFQRLLEIVVKEPLKLQIFEDDRNSMLGEMIYDICSGRIALIPHLSLKQCLELLTDLGLQKLKKNYFTILSSFNFQIVNDLQDKWNLLHTLSLKTERSTFIGLNIQKELSKLHFLYHVHSAIEFVALIKEKCLFSSGILTSVLKIALNKYVVSTVPDFCYGFKQICDITVNICFADIKDFYLESYFPYKWRVKFSSSMKNSSVKTSFHYTKKPVFPYSMYKCDNINHSSSEEHKLYVTRLESYSDKIW